MSIADNLYHYKFQVQRVIDGDTVVGRLDKGRNNFDENVRIRLLGINAPEMKGITRSEGTSSKHFLQLLIEGKEVIAKTHKADNDDSFGRMLADIYLIRDNGEEVHINAMMIEMGYAVPFMVKEVEADGADTAVLSHA